jgi:N-acetyl-anhydromuramyl-L-alanine amidase AmpD
MSATNIIPEDWKPAAKMQRIICHWTAGAHKASDFDRGHYHILIEADGKLIRGIPTIDANQAPVGKNYAAHTLNCNTGSIGVSLCCMAEAVEAPFNPGKHPMTEKQWDTLAAVVADLCREYKIPVGPKTVLSHAEVQSNLGILQRGKWDFTRLAFAPSVKGAQACGDNLRAAVAKLL